MREAQPPEDLWCVRTYRVKGGFTQYEYFENQNRLEYFLFKTTSERRTKPPEERIDITHIWHLDIEYGWIPWEYRLEPTFKVSGPPVEAEE